MLQIVGAVLVLTGTIGIGIGGILRLRRRCETLSAFISALELTESEIYFKLTPIPELMRRLAREGPEILRPFFERLSREEGGFPARWKAATEALSLELSRAERQVIGELAAVLGRYDTEGQTRAISYTRRRVEGFLKEAEAERVRSSKLYGVLGLAGGVAAVIVLI